MRDSSCRLNSPGRGALHLHRGKEEGKFGGGLRSSIWGIFSWRCPLDVPVGPECKLGYHECIDSKQWVTSSEKKKPVPILES